jgi:hypothetical protein
MRALAVAGAVVGMAPAALGAPAGASPASPANGAPPAWITAGGASAWMVPGASCWGAPPACIPVRAPVYSSLVPVEVAPGGLVRVTLGFAPDGVLVDAGSTFRSCPLRTILAQRLARGRAVDADAGPVVSFAARVGDSGLLRVLARAPDGQEATYYATLRVTGDAPTYPCVSIDAPAVQEARVLRAPGGSAVVIKLTEPATVRATVTPLSPPGRARDLTIGTFSQRHRVPLGQVTSSRYRLRLVLTDATGTKKLRILMVTVGAGPPSTPVGIPTG